MITGHHQQIQQLEHLITSHQLPHTLLFTGTEGIGKQLIAKNLAKALLCPNSQKIGGCGDCADCNKFESEVSPDFHYWDTKAEDTSKPEYLRQLLKDLSLNSFSGGNRILIIDNADALSTTAANILLKSLEEPLPQLYYILVSSNAARLPITILSRCQKIVFQDLTTEELQQVLKNLGPDYFENLKEEELAKLNNFDLHSISVIQQIDNSYELWQKTKELFKGLLQHKVGKLNQLKPLTEDKDQRSNFLFFLIILARHFQQSKLKQKCKDNEVEKWSIIINNLIEANYFILNRNINANYLLSDILIDISNNYAQPIDNYID